VLRLLKAKGYSLQANRDAEARSTPTVTRSFSRSTRRSASAHCGQPVISVDAKKRELVGDSSRRPRVPTKGEPVEVRGHDFKTRISARDPLRRLRPHRPGGLVSVGITSDTASFAVNSIIGWWEHLGRARYPARTADDHRRLGRVQNPRTASGATNCNASPTHRPADPRLPFPAGTRSGTKSSTACSARQLNWRGKPLESLEVIINLIANTSTSTA